METADIYGIYGIKKRIDSSEMTISQAVCQRLAWVALTFTSLVKPFAINICAMVKSRYIGDGRPPTFNRNPYNGVL